MRSLIAGRQAGFDGARVEKSKKIKLPTLIFFLNRQKIGKERDLPKKMFGHRPFKRVLTLLR